MQQQLSSSLAVAVFLLSHVIWTVSALGVILPMSCTTLSKGGRHHHTQLFGINEWRDTLFDSPGTKGGTTNNADGSLKEICILPFPYEEVLVQGETKQLRLYEDRFIKLFDYSQDKLSGVVAMGLLAESGIVQTVPICEIEAYNRMEGFGIFVTIRVVGRAQLQELIQQEPFLKGICKEISDKIPPNLELPNLVASNIENFMLLLSSMEHRLSKAMNEKKEDGSTGGGDDKESAKIRKRIQMAKLVSMFGGRRGQQRQDDEALSSLLVVKFPGTNHFLCCPPSYRKINSMMIWVMMKMKKYRNWIVVVVSDKPIVLH